MGNVPFWGPNVKIIALWGLYWGPTLLVEATALNRPRTAQRFSGDIWLSSADFRSALT